MNEISRQTESAEPGMTPALDIDFEHSTEIDKLFIALSKAQRKGLGAAENSPNPAFKSRYADLGSVASVFRDKVAPEGFCFMHIPIVRDRLVRVKTLLGHDSGQWAACTVAFMAQSSGPQHVGSAITYGKRYGLSAICGIVEAQDDDGNAAQGPRHDNQQRRTEYARREEAGPRRDESEPSDLGETARETVARTIINRARIAESVDDGHALLEAWLQRAAVLEELRGTDAWQEMERELGAGLKRSLGVEPAAAFVAALRASEPAHITALQSHWEGKWAATLGAMQQEAPETYRLLRRHVAAQITRVRDAHGEAQAAGGEAKPEEEQEVQTKAPAFKAVVLDDDGNPATDPFTDPVHFARAYAGIWTGTNPDRLALLAKHNIKALGQAAKNAEARQILDRLSEPETEAPKAEAKEQSPPADQTPPTKIRLVNAEDQTGAVEGDKTTPVHQRWIGRWGTELKRIETPEAARYWLKRNMQLEGGMAVIEKHWPDVYEAARLAYQQRLDHLERLAAGG